MVTGEPYSSPDESDTLSQPEARSANRYDAAPGETTTPRKAKDTVANAAQQTGAKAQQVAQQAQPLVDQAKDSAIQVKNQVQQQATTTLAGRKDQAAQGLATVAQAVDMLGHQLRENQQDAVAQYVERASEQIEHFSTYLRERDLGDLVGEVEGFARRQPAIFLAGTFTLGMLGARFLKSSGQRTTSKEATDQASPGYKGSLPANNSEPRYGV